MVISHLAASVAAKAQKVHRINPLRIVTESNIWEQCEPLPIEREDSEKMILNEFEVLFEKLDALYHTVENAANSSEEETGFSTTTKNLDAALQNIKSISPRRAKDALYYLRQSLFFMTDETLNDVFCATCEDPNLILPCDFV